MCMRGQGIEYMESCLMEHGCGSAILQSYLNLLALNTLYFPMIKKSSPLRRIVGLITIYILIFTMKGEDLFLMLSIKDGMKKMKKINAEIIIRYWHTCM